MKHSLFVTLTFVLLTSTVAFAGSSASRDPSAQKDREAAKKQIFDGCMIMSSQVVDVKKKICGCYVENFETKLGDVDLVTLAKSYVPDSKGRAPNVPMSETLTFFDYDVAMKCSKDPQWRLVIDPDDK